MVSLSDLPDETLLYHLLPVLLVQDVLALGATSRRYATLCRDETFWKMKCKEDFPFSSSRIARTTSRGWRIIYKGLSNPKIFGWGQATFGRLGRIDVPHGVPYPMKLVFPKKLTIVKLVAGGSSFHALDSRGRVYVWGALDGASDTDHGVRGGFSACGMISSKPLRLELPESIQMVSCGQKHSMALDCKGRIWTFLSWGRPLRLISPALDNSSPDATPIQVECGWSDCAMLTASGDVFFWWPFYTSIWPNPDSVMNRMDAEGDKYAYATMEDTIPCVTWDLQHDPQRLPAIPILPELSRPDDAPGDNEKETKLIKIAAMGGFIIGLTNKGHVLKIGDLWTETAVRLARWEYLPNYSKIERVRGYPVVAGAGQTEDSIFNTVDSPTNGQITHITACSNHFVAYTRENSVVLWGSTATAAEDAAKAIPELQGKSIISVSIGNHHSAALTADGHLYTWNEFGESELGEGALGLGVPETLPVRTFSEYAMQRTLDKARQRHRMEVPDVKIPTEVRFNYDFNYGFKLKRKRDLFCIAATAGGLHTGALVIDLDSEDEHDTAQNKALSLIASDRTRSV